MRSPRSGNSRPRGTLSDGLKDWGRAIAEAFLALLQRECDEVQAPEWWSDEALKVLSARVVRAAPNEMGANRMRATVLSVQAGAWRVGPRSAAELKQALSNSPAGKAMFLQNAEQCRSLAEASRFAWGRMCHLSGTAHLTSELQPEEYEWTLCTGSSQGALDPVLDPALGEGCTRKGCVCLCVSVPNRRSPLGREIADKGPN